MKNFRLYYYGFSNIFFKHNQVVPKPAPGLTLQEYILPDSHIFSSINSLPQQSATQNSYAVFCMFFMKLSHYISSKCTVIQEMEKIWNETIMAEFQILSQHLERRSEENHVNIGQETQRRSRECHQAPANKVRF